MLNDDGPPAPEPDADFDDDELFAELERDDDHHMAKIRELRMGEIRKEMMRAQELASSNGTYDDIDSEKEILKITTGSDKCVVHFYHKEFRRCQIVHKHMESLARKHYKTRFVKIDVEKCPFLVERLKIQVLPCIIAFIKGVSVDRIVGFDELGGSDNFSTGALEFRLAHCQVISDGREKMFLGKNKGSDEDEDYD
ncbi:hypothetical protein HDU97_000242 [Phlyctochytrium planicorne]|nr:hypothetical protein HDU97_000242 [Phlyctochytrium planicorne]